MGPASPESSVRTELFGRDRRATTVGVVLLICLVAFESMGVGTAMPAVFGLISSAWVLPSLVGQPVAGLVTEHLSWRWVFLGLLPLVLVAVGLILPAVRRLGPPDPSRAVPAPRRGLVAAAVAAAAGVVALSWAGQNVGAVAAIVAAVAVFVLVPALCRLLPAGVFRARRGVAAVVACRGLLTGTFFTVNSYLPLMLTSTHHWTPAAAGTSLLVGSLGWSAASAWQGRHPDLPRTALLRAGFCGMTVGTAGLLVVTPSWGIAALALPLWAVAGLGMGLAFSSVSYLLLGQSGAGEVGFASSAAQMADQLGTATMIGVGGTLLALLAPPSVALTVLVAVLALLAGLGTAIAGRSTPAAVSPS